MANVNEIETLNNVVKHQHAVIAEAKEENLRLKNELEKVSAERDHEILEKLRYEAEVKRVRSSIKALVHPLNTETRVTTL